MTLLNLLRTLTPQVTVYYNCIVYTVDNETDGGLWWKTPQEAFVVHGKEIVFVGSEVDAFCFTEETYDLVDVEAVDLKGNVVLPGIHDVHMHPLEAGMSVANMVLLESGASLDVNMKNSIKEQAAANRREGVDWILGGGHSLDSVLTYMETTGKDPKDFLDEAMPNDAVVLLEETSHSVWVNSKALEKAGITKDSGDIGGGIVLKNHATGEPNGILLEYAGNFMFDEAFKSIPTLDELNYEGLLESLAHISENGITSICDARAYWGRNHHSAWKRAETEGTLTVRAVLGMWAYPNLDDQYQITELRKLYSNDPQRKLKMSQIKMYSDGILHATTAALLEKYVKDYKLQGLEENKGMNYFTQEKIETYIQQLQTFGEGKGYDFHVHAIGDRSVRETLNAINNTLSEQNINRRSRHRLTHVEMVDPVDLERFRVLDVTADLQVANNFTLPNHRYENEGLIGAARAYDTIPVRSLWNTGARVTLSSDYDVSPLNPFLGIMHAAQRGHQSVSVHTAVEMYTINAAYVMRQEDRVGSLVKGKEADFIVIDKDIFNLPVADIVKTNVLMTVLEGGATYKKNALDFTPVS